MTIRPPRRTSFATLVVIVNMSLVSSPTATIFQEALSSRVPLEFVMGNSMSGLMCCTTAGSVRCRLVTKSTKVSLTCWE